MSTDEGGAVRRGDGQGASDGEAWGDLVHYWYAASRSEDLRGAPLGKVVLGVRVVLWRDGRGQARAHRDRCLHRNARLSGGVVVDGPFNEAKEVVGGFSVIDVPDMDAAIELVKTWPQLEFPGVAIEIRPMVEDYSQFE